MKNYFKLMRIKHYIKNGLIFLPLFFSNNLFEGKLLINSILAFIAFSFTCSAVYIINDINDIEKDKKHPIKRNRPLASGKIKISSAIVLAIVLIILASLVDLIVLKNVYAYILMIFYLFINVFYSLGLKKIPILDVTILMSGFLIRMLYGSLVVDVAISNWLYLTVMSMAFYLGLGKRRKELEKNSSKSRDVLNKYTKDFLDKNMYLCMGLTIVFYALWTIDPTISASYPLIIWTVPLVLIICMKYSLNVEGSSFGDPVDVLMRDKVLLILVLVYTLFISILIYWSSILTIIKGVL